MLAASRALSLSLFDDVHHPDVAEVLSDRSGVIQLTCNLLNQVCANMKSRLIRDRSNENPGLLGANPARSSGPQNDTERTGDLAPQSLGGAACGEVVAQQNEVAMFTP